MPDLERSLAAGATLLGVSLAVAAGIYRAFGYNTPWDEPTLETMVSLLIALIGAAVITSHLKSKA